MTITGDLVTMAGGAGSRVYAMGAVPSTPTYPYRVVGYYPSVPLVRTMNAAGDPVSRFVVQHFSRTADGLETVAAATFAAFDGKAFSGNVVTQEIATAPDRDADDRGVLSTTHTYRF